MEQIYKELSEQTNVRSNLSILRQKIKNQEEQLSARKWIAEHEALVLGFLSNEDAKTRKNAALFIGDALYQPFMEALWEAYCRETTLFVKSAYLTALSHLDAEPLLMQLEIRCKELMSMEPEEENRKHISEELHALRSILIGYQELPDIHSISMARRRNCFSLPTVHIEKSSEGVFPSRRQVFILWGCWFGQKIWRTSGRFGLFERSYF